MIFITQDIKAKDCKLIKNVHFVKKYHVMTVWFLFIPVYSRQTLIEEPKGAMSYDSVKPIVVTNEKRNRTYVPSQDEHRKMQGQDEANFE